MPPEGYTACDSALLAVHCEAVAAHAATTKLVASEDFDAIGTRYGFVSSDRVFRMLSVPPEIVDGEFVEVEVLDDHAND